MFDAHLFDIEARSPAHVNPDERISVHMFRTDV